MNEREVFDMLLEKHPTWVENIKIKGRTEQKIRMLAPYDVESIEELIQNVRAKVIDALMNEVAQIKGISDEDWNLLEQKAEQMKGVRNEH